MRLRSRARSDFELVLHPPGRALDVLAEAGVVSSRQARAENLLSPRVGCVRTSVEFLDKARFARRQGRAACTVPARRTENMHGHPSLSDRPLSHT